MDYNRNGNPDEKQSSNNKLLVHTNNRREGTDEIDGGITKAKSNTTEVDGCFGSMGTAIIQCGKGKYKSK